MTETLRGPAADLIVAFANQVGALADEMTFCGGNAAQLLVTDPAAVRVRATDDIDVIVAITSGTAYDRLVESLTDEDLPASAPLVDRAAQVHVDDLERAGIALTPGMRAQAILQNGRLTAGSLDLDRVGRFRLALETVPATPETRAAMITALSAAAARLGVRLVPGEVASAASAVHAVLAGDVRPVQPGPGSRSSSAPATWRTGRSRS